jgi:hypothetical protein
LQLRGWTLGQILQTRLRYESRFSRRSAYAVRCYDANGDSHEHIRHSR